MRFGFLLICLLVIPAYGALEFLFPPKDQEVVVGQTASFGIIPREQREFKFQWSKDGSSIPGTTNDQILLRHAGFADSGLYSVTVSDAEFSASAAARLLVRPVQAGDVDFLFVPDVSIATTAAVDMREFSMKQSFFRVKLLP